MIAALFVETNGSYYGLPGVDPWDEARDARQYAGPHPVVAHPPCQRWGKMWFGQPLTVKKTGQRKVKGDDGGCFAAALAAARKWGGVIEHPWGSHAWAHFGLNKPKREGGWIAADFHGGWTCCVEQGRYGHYARKPTLLLAYGAALPELRWGKSEARLDPAVVERMGLKRAKRLGEVGARGGGTDSSPRIGTPTEFRDLLISLAASVTPAEGTMSALGETMRTMRAQRGMSLQDVADEAGLTKSHVWDLERGRSRNPTIETVLNIALALGLEPATLAATAMADVRGVRSKPASHAR